MPGSAFVPNFMARHVEIHSREGSEHWFNRFGVVGDVNWRMSACQGLPLLQVFLHKLRPPEHSGV
jgi:hypothetical protein